MYQNDNSFRLDIDNFIGTEGIAEAQYTGGVFISGKNQWDSGIIQNANNEPKEEQRRVRAFSSSLHDADLNKGTAFIKSIETGNYLNDTFSGVESTLTAIMGREAAMSGEKPCGTICAYLLNDSIPS